MRVVEYRLLRLVVVCATVACSQANDPGTSGDAGVLRIGVLPDQSEQVLSQRYGPLIDYLTTTVAIQTELYLPASYDDLLDAFDRDRVQLAWFGGLTFIEAERASDALPLVMRDIDLEFTSDFLVRREAPEQSVEEFSGRRFSFGPELSTSGHLMPRYYLSQRGIEAETFFSEVRHSAAHDRTAAAVRDGEVDIGAVNSVVVESMFLDGRLARDEVRILGRTPPYRNYVWAVQSHLDLGLRRRLLDAFLALDRTVPAQNRILEALGTGGFIPASRGDYNELRAAARILEPTGTEGPK